MNTSPPSFFLRFFRWFCDPRMQNHIEGDLVELYNEHIKQSGKRKADIRFIVDVLLLFRPGIVRSFNPVNLTQTDMVASDFKTGLRNITRNKVYASINILGLTTGIIATLLIILYIIDEVNYDRFHADADHLYRIASTENFQGYESQSAVSSTPVAEALIREVPEVESATRFGLWRTMPMAFGENSFIERNMLMADSNFFQFFSFPVVAGDVRTMLKGVNKVVITEAAARRYFGSENPIGKIMLRGQGRFATEVTGVIKNIPSQSHIQFDMVLSGETWEVMQNDHWSNTCVYTYIKLRSPEDASAANQKLQLLTEKYLGPELEKILGISLKALQSKGNHFAFFLQPMLDIHLTSAMTSEISPNAELQYLYIFGAIAAFILLIACINFMNLSTARSVRRAKEVGVRKSIGAGRWQLIRQFLSESMIYSFLSAAIAITAIPALLGPFNTIAGKNISMHVILHPTMVIGVILFACIIGLIAGSYPAFYLTAFRPELVLKGNTISVNRNTSFRNSLVVFQFMVSTVLILSSIVVYTQLTYMQEKNLGFDKENVVVINNAWGLGNNAEAFKRDLMQHSSFKSVSTSSGLPSNIVDSNLFRKGSTSEDIVLSVCTTDYDQITVMGYALKEGRFFSAEFPSDTAAIVLNESAFNQLGFKNVDGQIILNFNAPVPTPLKLIGVIRDFNYENLRTTVKPIGFLLNEGSNRYAVKESNNNIAIRITPGDVPATLGLLETTWKKYATGAFEYSFLDENIDRMFRAEQRMSQLVFIFTVLTVLIACLGLFGLASYLAEQRGKEISIRKVLGASVVQMLFLLLRDFGMLIIIAFIIAIPLGYYFMENWLEEFAYRVGIEPWMPVLAGVLSLFIGLLSISLHSMKVARQNPVKALKSE